MKHDENVYVTNRTLQVEQDDFLWKFICFMFMFTLYEKLEEIAGYLAVIANA